MSKISPAARRHLAALLVVLMTAIRPGAAAVVDLPSPAAMPSSMNAPPVLIRAAEPHLSSAGEPVFVQYREWPAEQILDRWLGQAWRAPGAVVEFRALDGYVSHIPAERFEKYRAYLVFERPGSPFSVDNRLQNEKNNSLGPYYLVKDNLKDADLRAEGATYWPYQVIRIADEIRPERRCLDKESL